ncbi:MAG: hypothetical protein JNK85_03105 [Verrucomicrobiales bacterium]|nr:hypothetical protein [Verrucomicrobiales bacterium]
MLWLLAGLVLGRTVRSEESEPWVSLGPLIQTFPLTLEPGEGVEAAGPFYYRQDRENETLWAVPPFISSAISDDGERSQMFIIPPLFSYRRYGEDRRWQVGQLLNRSNQERIEDGLIRRFNVFPFFFYQDSPNPANDYWGLMPIYGKLQGRLFRDEVEFVLFPAWLKTRKGTMTTRNIAFPFIHFRDGPGLNGWQFWPLVGHEHLEPSTRTNIADDLEIVPGHDKTFALWPMYFRNRLDLGTTNAGSVDAVLPLFYLERTPKRDHTSVMWPFFSWTDNHEEQFKQWNTPWPLVGFARGEGKTLNRVIPLFSVGHTKTLEAQTYLWPIYRRRHQMTENFDRDRWQLGIVFYADLKELNKATGKTARRIDSWPLFSWTRDPDGNRRLQVLSVVEPFRRGLGIERNWSPLWSIWRDERSGTSDARSQSLLWNLYRRDKTPESTKSSLLFGLVQYEKTSAGRRWRWFFLGPRLEGGRAKTEHPAQAASHVPEHR